MSNLKKLWLRDLMCPFDRLRYLAWRKLHSKNAIVVALKMGHKLVLRPSPTTDLATAYEIFIDKAYKQPQEVPNFSHKLVVDLGANVGHSVVYWAKLFPDAQLIAYEPHPTHVEMIYRHLQINQLINRVSVITSAVSNYNGQGFLTNNENESSLVDKDISDCLPITVCDFFQSYYSKEIDLLKMDIEGGEYKILGDERFAELNIKTIVIEWHNTPDIPNGYSWCLNRLKSLGYAVADGNLRYQDAGILWAWS